MHAPLWVCLCRVVILCHMKYKSQVKKEFIKNHTFMIESYFFHWSVKNIKGYLIMSSILKIWYPLPVYGVKTLTVHQPMSFQLFRFKFHMRLGDIILQFFYSWSYSKLFLFFELLEILEFSSLRQTEIAVKLLKINQIWPCQFFMFLYFLYLATKINGPSLTSEQIWAKIFNFCILHPLLSIWPILINIDPGLAGNRTRAALTTHAQRQRVLPY